MPNEQESPRTDEFIGNDRKAWKQYYEQYGPEAYKYRRLYEEMSRQIKNLYKYADEHGVVLPSPGDSGSY